ncbi:MAG: hypothetical protein ACLUFT_11015 [Gemmiger formicilis]|uniref:hypothetical protein n=1 Tax=Gemmiger formicilis TaxID=745368 RepID=UPI0039918061
MVRGVLTVLEFDLTGGFVADAKVGQLGTAAPTPGTRSTPEKGFDLLVADSHL